MLKLQMGFGSLIAIYPLLFFKVNYGPLCFLSRTDTQNLSSNIQLVIKNQELVEPRRQKNPEQNCSKQSETKCKKTHEGWMENPNIIQEVNL
jgi:hypothetical protein